MPTEVAVPVAGGLLLAFEPNQAPAPGWLPFDKARAFVRNLRLASADDWRAWIRGERPDLPPQPPDIPSDPGQIYPKQWLSMSDWLGLLRRPRLPPGAPRMSFGEAREFVRRLNLRSFREWRAWRQGLRPDLPPVPVDLSSNPWILYRDKWVNWADWLGAPARTPGGRKGRRRPCSFEQARRIARRLKLRSGQQWFDYVKGCPSRRNLPAVPNQCHAAQWTGWRDFLGRSYDPMSVLAAVWPSYRPFRQARAFARKLHLPSSRAWSRWARGGMPELPPIPADIPAGPNKVRAFRKHWKSWDDWLGYHCRARAVLTPMPFEAARALARSLGLKSSTQWRSWGNGALPGLPSKPVDMPATPNCVRAYAPHWRGWPDWLGYAPSGGRVAAGAEPKSSPGEASPL